MQIECPSCKNKLKIYDFLISCSSYQKQLNVFKFNCPNCNAKVDSRIENSKIILGYLYGAGEIHFSGMIEYKFPHLNHTSNGTLEVDYNGKKWSITA